MATHRRFHFVLAMTVGMLSAAGSSDAQQSRLLDASVLSIAERGSTHASIPTPGPECSLPRWVARRPLDRKFLYVLSVGEGSTEKAAFDTARMNISRDLAQMTSAVVNETRGVRPSDRSFRIDISDLGTGALEQQTAICRVGNRVQVSMLTVVPVELYWARVVRADPVAGVIRFPSIWSEYVRRNGPPSRATIVFRSLYSPGAVQRQSGRTGLGWLVFTGVAGGAAVGIGGYFMAQMEADKAAAEISSQPRRDYFNNQSNQWGDASRIGYVVAGTAYATGVIDALALRRDDLASLQIGRHWTLRLSVRR